MEEIDLKDLFKYFMKKMPITLIVSFVFLWFGIGYTCFFKTPLYRGDTTLILVKKSDGADQSTSLTQNDIMVNQKLVSTYSQIIKSRRVLNQVIKKMGLECNVQTLSSKISVSSVSETEIIKISVSDKDKNEAAAIANKIAEVFTDEIVEIYNLENVTIIDKAQTPDAPYNISKVRSALLALIAGAGLTSAILFVIYYFDTSVKSSEQVEERLGIPVIGNVPLVRKKAK